MSSTKSTARPRRNEIDMGEVLSSYVQTCKAVPGALCPLKAFREATKVHAKSKLERHYRWRRTDKWPTGVRITRRSVCKVCNTIRPSATTCGDHWLENKKNVIKCSYVCGVVIPDVEPIVVPLDDESEKDDEEPAEDGKKKKTKKAKKAETGPADGAK